MPSVRVVEDSEGATCLTGVGEIYLINMMKELSELSTVTLEDGLEGLALRRRDQALRIESALANYDYNAFLEKNATRLGALESYFTKPKDGVNRAEQIAQFTDALSSGKTPIFTGAFKMGKTSTAFAWQAESPSTRVFIDTRLLHGVDIREKLERGKTEGKTDFFLDEVTVDAAFQSFIHDSLADIRSCVLSTRLLDAKALFDLVQSEGLEPVFVAVPLTPDEDLRKYLAQHFSLEDGDALVEAIVALSGGCLFVANTLCTELCAALLEHEDSEERVNPSRLSKQFLRSARESLFGEFSNWNGQRDDAPEEFLNCIPNPLLEFMR